MKGHHDRNIQLVDVGHPESLWRSTLNGLPGKLQILRGGTRRRDNFQGLKGLQRNFRQARAASRHGERLNSRKGKIQVTGGKERQLTGDLILEDSIPAQLFSFLSDDRRDQSRQVKVAANCKSLNNILQRSKNEIGKSSSQDDSRIKVFDGEVILTGLDRGNVEMLEGIVGGDGVKFFLLFDISFAQIDRNE